MGNSLSADSYLHKHACSARNLTWQYVNRGHLPTNATHVSRNSFSTSYYSGFNYSACPWAEKILSAHGCWDGSCMPHYFDHEMKRYELEDWDGLGNPLGPGLTPEWWRHNEDPGLGGALDSWRNFWIGGRLYWPVLMVGKSYSCPLRVNGTLMEGCDMEKIAIVKAMEEKELKRRAKHNVTKRDIHSVEQQSGVVWVGEMGDVYALKERDAQPKPLVPILPPRPHHTKTRRFAEPHHPWHSPGQSNHAHDFQPTGALEEKDAQHKPSETSLPGLQVPPRPAEMCPWHKYGGPCSKIVGSTVSQIPSLATHFVPANPNLLPRPKTSRDLDFKPTASLTRTAKPTAMALHPEFQPYILTKPKRTLEFQITRVTDSSVSPAPTKAARFMPFLIPSWDRRTWKKSKKPNTIRGIEARTVGVALGCGNSPATLPSEVSVCISTLSFHGELGERSVHPTSSSSRVTWRPANPHPTPVSQYQQHDWPLKNEYDRKTALQRKTNNRSYGSLNSINETLYHGLGLEEQEASHAQFKHHHAHNESYKKPKNANKNSHLDPTGTVETFESKNTTIGLLSFGIFIAIAFLLWFAWYRIHSTEWAKRRRAGRAEQGAYSEIMRETAV